jgi:L-lactate permease
MRVLLYLVALVLLIGWCVGVFSYGASGFIHSVLVLAVIILLLGLIRKT